MDKKDDSFESLAREVASLREQLAKYQANEIKINSRKRAKRIASIGGTVAGAGAVGWFLGDVLRKSFEGIGEAYHGLKTGTQIASLNLQGEDLSQKYVEMLDPQLSEIYFVNLGNERHLSEGSGVALEAIQRGALKLPTVESEPVKDLRGLKGRIIETTKGWFTGDEQAASQQNTPQYQQNYDALARLRLNALIQREETRNKMKDLSQKLEASNINTGLVDQNGIENLEGLVVHYNKVSDVLRNIGDMEVNQIFAGRMNESYDSVIKQADEYGIKPYDSSTWGDAGVIGTLLLGAYIGHKVSKPLTTAGFMAYDVAKNIPGLASFALKNTQTLAKGTGRALKYGASRIKDMATFLGKNKLLKRIRKS